MPTIINNHQIISPLLPMSDNMQLLNWNTNSCQIKQRLSHDSVLKICVKTKNETEMLRHWIEHHAKIIGYKNLIVADNNSDDLETLALYAEYRDKITIFSFEGSHNEIHWSPRFMDFFEIIRNTSKFFAFIDVDERLISVSDNRWDVSSSLLEILAEENSIYATTWLINALNSYSVFTLLDTERRQILKNNLSWGKPILPKHLVGVQSGIHNIQFKNYKFARGVRPHLYLLHLTQFPEQRIAANRNKLYSRRLINGSESIQEIEDIDFSLHPDTSALRFQAEIKYMRKLKTEDETTFSAKDDLVEFCQTGELRFSRYQAKIIFEKYNSELDSYLKDMSLLSQLLD